MNDIFDPVLESAVPDVPTSLPLYGGAERPLEDMTGAERKQASEQVYTKVREQAFSRGLPVIIERNGRGFREFADGHVEPIT